MRRWLPLLVLALFCALPAASAQPPARAELQWSVFVGGPGRRGQRTMISDAAGQIRMGETPWRCGYATPRVAAISPTDWSSQRVLACQRGEASVSATASCRVRDGQVEEHAATLSLGTVGARDYVTVTLGCRGR